MILFLTALSILIPSVELPRDSICRRILAVCRGIVFLSQYVRLNLIVLIPVLSTTSSQCYVVHLTTDVRKRSGQWVLLTTFREVRGDIARIRRSGRR